MTTKSHWTEAQVAGLPLLVEGATFGAVARAVGCDRSTVGRWLKNPEFRQAVADGQREIAHSAVRVLKGSLDPAARVVADFVRGKLTERVDVQRAQVAMSLLDRFLGTMQQETAPLAQADAAKRIQAIYGLDVVEVEEPADAPTAEVRRLRV